MKDNFDFYDAYERHLERESRRRPHCDLCEEPIFEDHAYRIGEYLVCERCVENSKEYLEEDY